MPYTRRFLVILGAIALAVAVVMVIVVGVSPRTGTPAGQRTNSYPSDVVAHYLSMCKGDGNSTALCTCYLTSMQRHYPYEQAKPLLTTNSGAFPEYRTLIQDCASEIAR